jgi:hypothetical protein
MASKWKDTGILSYICQTTNHIIHQLKLSIDQIHRSDVFIAVNIFMIFNNLFFVL